MYLLFFTKCLGVPSSWYLFLWPRVTTCPTAVLPSFPDIEGGYYFFYIVWPVISINLVISTLFLPRFLENNYGKPTFQPKALFVTVYDICPYLHNWCTGETMYTHKLYGGFAKVDLASKFTDESRRHKHQISSRVRMNKICFLEFNWPLV